MSFFLLLSCLVLGGAACERTTLLLGDWPAPADIRALVTCFNADAGISCVTANAGPDQIQTDFHTVQLDAGDSQAPQPFGALGFAWVQVGGPAVVLQNAEIAEPEFTPVAFGVYSFEVTVTWLCMRATDRVDIHVVDIPSRVNATQIASVVTGLPHQVTYAGPGDSRLFIVEKGGRIWLYKDNALLMTPFLDISGLVSTNSERGLLGLAFDPDYAMNGLFYVNYTSAGGGDTVIAAYHVSEDPDLADAASEVRLLEIDQPFANHNGGQIQFGPDGLLYIAMGDGGSFNDPFGNGQNPMALLGKMLRIEVDGDGYTAPLDNPFIGNAAVRDEIWALGLRNPWRFSFDRETGDLFIADVGQNQYEEINFQAASSAGGENYGWDIKEGFHCFEHPTNCLPEPVGLTDPILEYSHLGGDCSITGGFVYRGTAVAGLNGAYLYADYCSGRFATLRFEAGLWVNRTLEVFVAGSQLTGNVVGFGEDAMGELYICLADGGVYRIESAAFKHK